MNTKNGVLRIRNWLKEIDWKLLVFLLLFLNVKLAVKVAAIIIVFLMQPDFTFDFRWKDSRLPLFYPFICLIAIINLIIYQGFFQVNYDVVFIVGMAHWLLCLLAIHQLKAFTEKQNPHIIYRTIAVFFIINSLWSFVQITQIILETGAINPYRYQGEFQKYFISTGDYIKGITFDTSTTNAALNAFGIIFFLYKRNILMVLLCMTTLLMAASNLVNILLIATFAALFAFKIDKDQKSIIIACCLFMAIFFGKISPQNGNYIMETLERITNKKLIARQQPVKEIPITEQPDNQLTTEQRKEKIATLYLDSIRKIRYQNYFSDSKEKKQSFEFANYVNGRPTIPQANIHSAPYQHRNDTNAVRKELLQFISEHTKITTASNHHSIASIGKLLALNQTIHFFEQNPQKLMTGAGMGNFSSKLAFRTTALHFAGGYPAKFAYMHPDFEENHLGLYLSYFSKTADEHSITNSPNSVYDQLISEYGILGFGVFLIFYAGYILKSYRKLSYGLPLACILFSLFFIDYWFEQLSIVILFELLLLLDKKEALLKQ
ncbi:hypothetical protein OCK74_07645 [Chitinophagaceae bacterium LB-8]|uniref:O-antigen ligase domain-containing protein n=1 Tax=Paraflavisolibacter caeni TaxID=2982496 RepID=A0A9X2XU87_9BACT|nr:hypothetical protein [Paraflavisolibacter caeni]MCU7548985.1 hypothetical protein [Paraflavisolibacter caeni]